MFSRKTKGPGFRSGFVGYATEFHYGPVVSGEENHFALLGLANES